MTFRSLALSSTAQYIPAFQAVTDYDKHQYQILCERLPGLNPAQIAICRQHPFAIPSIGRGARDSVVECQTQFKYERWNCSERIDKNVSNSISGFQDLLGRTLRAGNKETAFISAVASAGIVHAITKGCSTGNLTECGCDNQPSAQRYTDTAIVQNMHKQCRCHGVSGSCEFRTCWLQMPKFAEVGEMLKQRYNHFSVQVARRAKKRLRRKERSERKKPLRGNEIAYINKSPNYCEPNEAEGAAIKSTSAVSKHGVNLNRSYSVYLERKEENAINSRLMQTAVICYVVDEGIIREKKYVKRNVTASFFGVVL
ncbi:unnamed protein product [Anisakis simplex]|uniref:Protein Wnt n=1 Tax=Anisakis simplex TaxID=6269 RepID=A0A158PPP5_ANISI|nr:unnamed protein product [Anisakis simplex]